MPFLAPEHQLARILEGEIATKDGLASLFDRQSGLISLQEDIHIDYKLNIDPESDSSIGEFARDVLGFSNADGGIILLGVSDAHYAVGISGFVPKIVRNLLGPFVGTRVIYELDKFEISVAGRKVVLAYALIPRTETNYPHLLRKDIVPPRSFIRKPKYVKGTLFYREDDSILSESPFGDVDAKARDLRFSAGSPRTSTSFQISEDRPLLRLYSPINDRFFGRRQEINNLIAEFEGARGRGVSIGGFGGVGKTELAINLVSRLHKGGRFKLIYSASAKQTVLGSTGVQLAEPLFTDLKSFLLDFSGWLGLSLSSSTNLGDLKSACLQELATHRNQNILVFVDNLETVKDRELFHFLDSELPNNCWILATSRVHKLRRFLLHTELTPMDADDDAARLLRHELKRQGLPELSGKTIGELSSKAKEVLNHPLAVRWYAWACRKDPTQWDRTVNIGDLRLIEDFCVSSTLNSLGEDSQRVLGAVLAIDSANDSTMECIQNVANVDSNDIEGILWDLECSGMLAAATDENGLTCYSVASMARRLSSEIARGKGWEKDYVQRLRRFSMNGEAIPQESPLIRDLLAIRTQSIRSMDDTDKREIVRRIERALPTATGPDKIRLLSRKAECERHLQQLVTADETYSKCASFLLSDLKLLPSEERWHILLEAATVAKTRAISRVQINKAVGYLEAAETIEPDNSRATGMLAEFYGLLGNREKVAEYTVKGQSIVEDEDPDSAYAVNLVAALQRAKENLTRPVLR